MTLSRSFPSIQASASTASASNQVPTTAVNDATSAAVPAASDTNSSDPSLGSGDGIKAGDVGTPWAVILGAVGGVSAAIVILTILVFLCLRRRKRRNQGTTVIMAAEAQVEHTTSVPARRFDPSYHTSKEWKHRSFLDMLSAGQAAPSANAGTGTPLNRASKRMTDLLNDPKSFFSPRAAPRPFATAFKSSNTNDSVESLRYTTTSQRLKDRNRDDSLSSGSDISFGVGSPKVVNEGYVKAKDFRIPKSARSTATMAVTPSVITRGPDVPGLLAAVQVMKQEDEDDPHETPTSRLGYTPTSRAFGDSAGFPFPNNHNPPGRVVDKDVLRPPPLRSRSSYRVPVSRYSTTSSTPPANAIPLPHPPITAATDFTLPPEEYRRRQTRYNSGQPQGLTGFEDKTSRASAATTMPSLYEPDSAASGFSQGRSQQVNANEWNSSHSAGKGLILSGTPSTESRYSSFLPDAQTVQRVKGMFDLSDVQFPMPPTGSARNSIPEEDKAISPREWGKAKSRAKLTQEVMMIGKTHPVQERGNENGLRRGNEL